MLDIQKITPHLTLLLALTLSAIGCTANSSVSGNSTIPERQFTPLINGSNLDGWRIVGGEATYSVDNGEIVGVCMNTKRNTFLRTEKTYSDFEFRAQFKWDTPGNSGIQYRSQQKLDNDKNPTGQVYGYQFELDSSPRAWSGGFYEEGRRGWLYNLEGDDKADKRAAIKLDDWNDIVIQCKGNHVRTWLNGVAIVDYVDEAPEQLSEGFFALQVHSGGSAQMRWRDLRIYEYPTNK